MRTPRAGSRALRGTSDRLCSNLSNAGRRDEFSATWLLLRGGRLALPAQPDQAIEHAGRALAYADATENDEFRLDALALLARAHAARGEQDASRTACDAFLGRWHTVGGMHHQTVALVETGVVLAADQRHPELATALALLTTPSPWADAARALAEGRYEEAAAILDSIPSFPLRDATYELIRTVEPTHLSGKPQA